MLAGARVEGAHVARRIVAVRQPIADAVAEDHQVLVDDRRRRVRVVLLVDRPDEPLAQVEHAVRRRSVSTRRAGGRVEADQVIAAVDEDAQLVAVGGVAPRRDAAVHEAGAVGRLAVLVGLRIERPQLGAGLGVQRDDAVVRRAEVQHVVDHQRRRLEVAGARAERGRAPSRRRPFPRDAEPRDRRRVDVGQRRVLHPALIAAVERPVLLGDGAARLQAGRFQPLDRAPATSSAASGGLQHGGESEDYNARHEIESRFVCRVADRAGAAARAEPDRPDSRRDRARRHRQDVAERDDRRAGIQNHVDRNGKRGERDVRPRTGDGHARDDRHPRPRRLAFRQGRPLRRAPRLAGTRNSLQRRERLRHADGRLHHDPEPRAAERRRAARGDRARRLPRPAHPDLDPADQRAQRHAGRDPPEGPRSSRPTAPTSSRSSPRPASATAASRR